VVSPWSTIAICLAVIGIGHRRHHLGVLPIGMTRSGQPRGNHHQSGRHRFHEAIRGGARGLDDLTNYVYAITNYWTYYPINGIPQPGVNGYDYAKSSTIPSTPYYPSSPITNRHMNIIGLLSTSEFNGCQRRSARKHYRNQLLQQTTSFRLCPFHQRAGGGKARRNHSDQHHSGRILSRYRHSSA